MKKKELLTLFGRNNRIKRCLLFMNYLSILILFCSFHVSANVFSQQEKVTFKSERLSVEEIFDAITLQLKYDVFYSEDKLNTKDVVQLSGKVMLVDDVLQKVLGKAYSYRLEGQTIFITPAKAVQQQATEKMTISLTVKDKSGEPLPGVTVMIKGTTTGGATDLDGKFSITIPQMNNVVLVVSFVGMKTVEVSYKGHSLNIVMEEDAASLDEVVVTGIFERKTESFTGVASTYKSDQLKMIGGQNVLQSLRTLDPSFSIKENNQFGSDPNRLPDMEIRGKSSVVGMKETFGSDPNQPLFILDGFEVPLQFVVDMNVDRIGSITILKDAASTAIYGSRAANGVVVIESKKPEPGQLRVRYSGDLSVSMPDLSGYNLMNAREKLEFERLAGMYTNDNQFAPENQISFDKVYNERLYNVNRGVDTYWLGEPVRSGLIHKHNLAIDGGDDNVLYSLGVSYGKTNGVMELSDRSVLTGNFMLNYRKKKINFSNNLTVDYTQSNNPVVPFSAYAKANPYYTKTDENGKVNPYLYNQWVGGARHELLANPIYDASRNNLDKTENLSFRENLQLEYTIVDNFKVSGRISLSKGSENVEKFKSPFLSEYQTVEQMKRGSYNKVTTKDFSYDGDIIVRYGHLFAEKHQVNGVGGWQFGSNEQIRDGFMAIGFPNDEVMNPAFSVQYEENSKPEYAETRKKSTSFYANVGYSYDRRYQVDANFRMDGSSVFGTNRRFTGTWSCGVSWNVHNEKFIKIPDWINTLRLRASVGNPGNQNFSSYQSYTTYAYNAALQNYFGLGALVIKFGNPDLLWQKTLDRNFGGDIVFFENRFRFNVNVYRKTTDPLLVVINTPSSVGSTEYTTNFGKQKTKGWDATLSYAPLYRPAEQKTLTLSLTARKVRDRYAGIGNKLGGMNTANQQTSLTRYYDGGSPNDLWAVRSAGIDPATGQEIFIKKDGTYTFEHDFDDEVNVGNSEPKLEGTVGAVLYYKGFSLSAYFRYRYNATLLNDALYSKVENITESNWLENQDRRAYYSRWQKPGDKAQFKGVALVKETAPRSDRFIQTENSFSGESFSMGYEFVNKPWMKALALSNLSLRANMNEMFRISTVKAERGIDYPFARTVTFSLSASF